MNKNFSLYLVVVANKIIGDELIKSGIAKSSSNQGQDGIAYILCKNLDLSHPHYLEGATVVNDELETFYIHHSCVAAIHRLVNLQNRPGFLQKEDLEKYS